MSDIPRRLRLSNQGLRLRNEYYQRGPHMDIVLGTLQGREFSFRVWRARRVNEHERRQFIRLLVSKVDVWKNLRHPNIIEFFGLVEGHHQLPYMVLPPENVNVITYLARTPNTNIILILISIASALSYMHAQQRPAVHGELRGINILMTRDGVPRLTDVGISQVSPTPEGAYSHRASVRWTSPEVLYPPEISDSDGSDGGGEPGQAYRLTTYNDVFAFGMTVLELLTGKPPFHYWRHDGRVIQEVVRGTRPLRPSPQSAPQLTDDMWSLMDSCWAHMPEHRPTMQTVHSWVSVIAGIGGPRLIPLGGRGRTRRA